MKRIFGIAIAACFVAPIVAQAADTPVVVNNTTDKPVPTKVLNTVPTTVTNTATNPIPSVITNSSTNLINTKVWNTVNVKVGNTATTPVPNVSVDNPGLTPAQYEVAWFSGTSSGFTETASFTVPAGKQYVIEGVSSQAYAPSSTEVVLKVTTIAGGMTATHIIVGFKSSLIYGNYFLLGFTPITLYADAGSRVTVDVVRQTPAGASTGYYSDVVFSGHYVKIP